MIEYLAPSGNGISNLKYIENNLSTADFTKLNSDPIILINTVAGKTIFPIAISIQYSNVTTNTSNGFYAIGALSVLQNYNVVAACMMALNSFAMNGENGTLFLSNNYTNPQTGFATNAATDTPLVLWDEIDIASNTFSTFIFKCLYLEI